VTSVAELLREAATLDSDSARLDAQLLLCHVLDRDRTWLFTWPETQVDDQARERFRALLAKRRAGHPVAHLLEEREFWSLPLKVSPATLIPRPDTELLVETALTLAVSAAAQVLDLGTGTGAIALALASERQGWTVSGVDRVDEAVALARANATALGLERVRFWRSDWFAAVTGHFELILSNPPYVAPDDPHLDQGDLRFEPHSALVAADRGYADLAFIIAGARDFLVPGGWLAVEHGAEQGERVRGFLAAHHYIGIETVRDFAGHERVSYGQWPEESRNG